MKSSLTILRVVPERWGRRKLATKRYRFDGLCWHKLGKGYDHLYRFAGSEEAAEDIHALHRLLEELAEDPHALVVRGAIRDDVADRSHMGRRIHPNGPSDPSTLERADRDWACFDIDEYPAPPWLDINNPQTMRAAARLAIADALPWLTDATVVVQWSSSMGLASRGVIKLHVWAKLSRPVCTQSLRNWAELARWIDPKLYTDAQPHYIAHPICLGAPDPLDGQRILLLEGSSNVAVPPEEIVDLETHRAREAAAAAKRIERRKRRGPGSQVDIGAPQEEVIESALTYIDADDRDIWVKVGLALHDWGTGSKEAFALWDGWSQTSDKYSVGATTSVWRSFGGQSDRRVTIGTVYHLARLGGFRFPKHEQKKEAWAQRDPDMPAVEVEVVGGGARLKRHKGFLDISDIDGNERFIMLEAEQSRGKTTLFTRACERLEADEIAIYVSCRRALIEDAATRIGATSYLRIKGDIDVTAHKRVAICADSLHRLKIPDGTKIALLLIDESDQVARHLFGGTIARSSHTTSLACYDALRGLITSSERIICADADLGESTRELVRGRRGGAEVEAGERLVRHTGYAKRTVFRHETLGGIYADLIEHLIDEVCVDDEDRLPTGIVCTSQKEAARLDAILKGRTIPDEREGDVPEDLVEALRAARPKLRILRIDQTTAGGAAQREFMRCAADCADKYDVIISSPTLGTGISIDWPVSRVYGIGTVWPRGIPGTGFLQMLWRYRKPVDESWHVWIDKRNDGSLPKSWEAVDARGRVGSKLLTSLGDMIRERREGGRRVVEPVDQQHWSLYCTSTATLNRDRAYLYGSFENHCAARGYVIEDVDIDQVAHLDVLDDHRETASEVLREEEVKKTLSADQIEWSEYLRIKDVGAKDDAERYAAQRATIAHARGSDYRVSQMHLGERDVGEFLDGWLGRGRAAATYRLLRTAFSANDPRQPDALAALSALEQDASGGGQWEEREGAGGDLTDAQVIARLLSAAGVDPLCEESYLDPRDAESGDRARVYSRQSLEEGGFIDWVERHRARIDRVFPLGPGWEDDPVGLVARALDRFGLKRNRLQRRDEAGERVREYWLAPEAGESLRRWSDSELERLLGWGRRIVQQRAREQDTDLQIRLAAGEMADGDPWGTLRIETVLEQLVADGIGSAWGVRSALAHARQQGESDSDLLSRLARERRQHREGTSHGFTGEDHP